MRQFKNLGWFQDNFVFQIKSAYRSIPANPRPLISRPVLGFGDHFGQRFLGAGDETLEPPATADLSDIKNSIKVFVDRGTQLLIRFFQFTEDPPLDKSPEIDKPEVEIAEDEFGRDWSTYVVLSIDF